MLQTKAPFDTAFRRVLAVPKAEVERREREHPERR
jgi:hypothetical protein